MNDKWKDEVKPSMKRRMDAIDYSQPHIYMITIATEGRKPLFGKVVPIGEEGAQIEMTPLGRWVNQEVEHIPRIYPQITIVAKQVMPDHLHFIIYVREQLPVHLGRVINGFKVGCNRGYREFCMHGSMPHGRSLPQSGTPLNPPFNSTAQPMGRVEWSASQRQTNNNRDRSHGFLFETGYHDRVLSGRDQLQRMIDYIHDNPRRLLLKRQNSSLFHITTITAAGMCFVAVGTTAIINAPTRIAVRISRSTDAACLAAITEDLVSKARSGAVMISPFISPGEKVLRDILLAEHLPHIRIDGKGFEPYYKPQGADFDAVADGFLLILAPWEYDTRRHLGKADFEELNRIAKLLATEM